MYSWKQCKKNFKAAVFKASYADLWESQDFSRGPKSQNYFCNNTMKPFALSLCWHLKWCWESSGSGTLAWTKPGAPNCTSNHCSHHCYTHMGKRQSLWLSINLIKSLFLNTHIFKHCVWWKLEVHMKALLPKYNGNLEENDVCIASWTRGFFNGT